MDFLQDYLMKNMDMHSLTIHDKYTVDQSSIHSVHGNFVLHKSLYDVYCNDTTCIVMQCIRYDTTCIVVRCIRYDTTCIVMIRCVLL